MSALPKQRCCWRMEVDLWVWDLPPWARSSSFLGRCQLAELTSPTAASSRMQQPQSQAALAVTVERAQFALWLEQFRRWGYELIGPAVRDGAIVYDAIGSAEDLPVGWTDEQGPGRYRLKRRPDAALFGYTVGPHAWKRFLHPPRHRLARVRRENDGLQFQADAAAAPKLALVGVRACDLQALALLDKVLAGNTFADPHYAERRRQALVVAVNCLQPASTCFCASVGAGPRVRFGFDLALTEVLADGRHYFVAEAGSELGRELLKALPHQPTTPEERATADRLLTAAAGQMSRVLDTTGLKELLYRNYEHPRWEQVARRCLTCANCTLVCPTCFCTTVEDITDLTGAQAERWRRWDSCFTADFSYIHGGSVRATARSRYRHWLTHKLATWLDQFGALGCVGCGRCITWCPVGIDLTEEVRAIRHADGATLAQQKEPTHASQSP
jgi:sulfhydrogenase subunit beta (sulfur reductase)